MQGEEVAEADEKRQHVECVAGVDNEPEVDDMQMGQLLRRDILPRKLQGQGHERVLQQQPDITSSGHSIKKSKHIGLSLAAATSRAHSSSSLPQQYRPPSAATAAPAAARTHTAKQSRTKQQAAPFFIENSKRVLGLNVVAGDRMPQPQEMVREMRGGVRQVAEYKCSTYKYILLLACV